MSARKRLLRCMIEIPSFTSSLWASTYLPTSATLGSMFVGTLLPLSMIHVKAHALDVSAFEFRPFDSRCWSRFKLDVISWLIGEIMTFLLLCNYYLYLSVLVVCNTHSSVRLTYSEGQLSLICRVKPSGRRLPLSFFCLIFSKILSLLRYLINSH